MSNGNILTIIVLVVVLLAINFIPRWLKKKGSNKSTPIEPKSGWALKLRNTTWDIQSWFRKHRLGISHDQKVDKKKIKPKAEKKGVGHYVWESIKFTVSLLVSLTFLALIYLNMQGGMFGGFDLWPFGPFPKFMFGG